MKHQVIDKLLCAALLLGGAACAAETGSQLDEEGVLDVSDQNLVLAEAEVPGGKVTFLALDDETVLVESDTVGFANPLRDPALRGLTIVDAYEYWTGKAAPAELVAHAGELLLPVPGADQQAIERDTTDGVGVNASALSANDFSSQFCNPAVTDFCWLDRTGTWEREQSSRYFDSVTDAVSGDVTVGVRRWEVFGGWTQVSKRTVFQDHVLLMGAASEAVFPRPLKFKIADADGDHWHLKVNWY